MDNTTLVSIVMPVKNTSKYLEECLDSIVRQTHKNWELYAVDDNSDDNSYGILEKYSDLDPRINTLRNNGTGILSALRLAFGKCSGEFITRMDSDDIMPDTKLESLQNMLLSKGKGHVSTGLVKYFAEGELGNGFIKYQDWLNRLSNTDSHYSDMYKECVIPSPCWMMYTSDFIDCGAFEPDVYPEDYDLTFRLYRKGIKISACKEILHLWRDYSTRASRTDPNYEVQHFFDLKLRNFLELEISGKDKLVIWGAGKKGKDLAGRLNKDGRDFNWICNNENKFGKIISGVKLQPVSAIEEIENPKIIISVAAEEDQAEIQFQLDNLGLVRNKHYYYFC